MIHSIFKRDLSQLSALKERSFHVRINGPYYSYRDPTTGKREFIFDEEIQNYLDDGLTLPKAIDRFLRQKYSRRNREQHQKVGSVVSSLQILSPWHEKLRPTPSDSIVQFRELRSSTSSTLKQPSFIAEEDEVESEELNDEQKPLVSVSINQRRWELKLDVETSRHGAMSILCMKDDLQRYMAACKQFQISPSQVFIDQIGARAVRIKYHMLTAIELGPVLHTLADRVVAPTTSLDFSCNPLTDKAAGLLVAFLSTSAADCLTYLNLSECMLGLLGGKQILDCVQGSYSIKELYLSGNDLTDAIGPCLQNFVVSNRILKHLDVSRNDLSVSSAERLAVALSNNTSLHSLNVSWNGIRLKGGEAIGKALVISSLTEIDLSWNGVANNGVRIISAALVERCCNLKVLNLASNRIGHLGANALARALRHNRTLKRLDLTMNPITTEGVKALLNALISNYNTGLELLEIRDVPIEQGFNDLIEKIRRRKTKRNGPGFNVLYGHVIHDPDFYVSANEAFDRVNDPVAILFNYIKEKGLRLLDLFAQFDKDHSSTLSLEEFRRGFIDAKIPLSEAQLDYLFGVMDINADDEIDYGELLVVQQQYRENLRRKMRIAQLEEEDNLWNEIKLPRLPSKEDVSDPKKRETILKARDALMHHNSPTPSVPNSEAESKLPDISAAIHQGSLSTRRLSSFKAALDAERRKLFNSINNKRSSRSSVSYLESLNEF